MLASWKSLTKRAGSRVGSGAESESVKQVCRSKDLETYQKCHRSETLSKTQQIKKIITNNFNIGSHLLFAEFRFYIQSSVGLWEEMRQTVILSEIRQLSGISAFYGNEQCAAAVQGNKRHSKKSQTAAPY